MTNTCLDPLATVHHEDMDDAILRIERSFNIKFEKDDLEYPWTFGQLCDVVVRKSPGTQQDDCTSQQAFYKLREAFSALPYEPKNEIRPDSSLEELLPRKTRIRDITNLDRKLGISTNLLRPKYWLTATIILLFLTSLVMFFFNTEVASWTLLGWSVLSTWAGWTAKELNYKTVRVLVNRLTYVNYRQLRRDPSTFNAKEIEDRLKTLFVESFGFDEMEAAALTRESRFG